MATQSNFLVKVKNARLGDVRKALTAAGIEVRSIAELHKEDIPDPEPSQAPEADKQDAKASP